MQLKVLNTTDMGRRVQKFLDVQGAAIGVAVPAELRARLDGAVTQLVASQAEQDNSAGAARTAVKTTAKADKMALSLRMIYIPSGDPADRTRESAPTSGF